MVTKEQRIAFLNDLADCFEKHKVDGVFYTNDDDGIHFTIGGQSVLEHDIPFSEDGETLEQFFHVTAGWGDSPAEELRKFANQIQEKE